MIKRSSQPGGITDLCFNTIGLGSIKPKGWLADQLRTQADGLSGHLDEFWPDIAHSGWVGGDAEGWERGPYWLDGLVPLAYLLDDPALKHKVTHWIDYILDHQHPDGWLGPIRSNKGNYHAYDPWPVFVVLKVFTQFYEATEDERIIPTMQRFLHRLDQLLDEQPLFVWGKSRWADLVLSIHWLYRHTGESWLLDLAAKVKSQGFDWRAHFADFKLRTKTVKAEANQISHVVNNAMAIKAPGVWYRQSLDRSDRASVYEIISALDQFHGQVTGMFSGDEHLAGRSPSQGTELCAVVEYMFSLEVLLCILGDPLLADRLERIAYNALPATFTADMWAHQYDQQANQVICSVGPHIWTTNGTAANTFGLEPNYGCCTANMHQGWPKLATHLWLHASDGGLVAAAYAPCSVTANVGDTQITVMEETDYPFDGTVHLTVKTPQSIMFPLYIRIPGWAQNARVIVAGKEMQATSGQFLCIERTWESGDEVELIFPLQVTCERRYNNAVSLWRGPLVFSLKIGEEFRTISSFGPAKDYEIWPTTPWNYALQLDCNSSLSEQVRVATAPVSSKPFDPEHPPVILQVTGRRFGSWCLQEGFHDAAEPPLSPVQSTEPAESLTLIPYGSTHLRITEFPVLL